jgi:hypothetical protein
LVGYTISGIALTVDLNLAAVGVFLFRNFSSQAGFPVATLKFFSFKGDSMKKLFVLVCATLLGASLSFAAVAPAPVAAKGRKHHHHHHHHKGGKRTSATR